jgi:hypothetical protein
VCKVSRRCPIILRVELYIELRAELRVELRIGKNLLVSNFTFLPF